MATDVASETTILVVDDDRFTRELVSFALQAAGYRVVGAESGRAALATLTQTSPDAVVLDIRLPDIDGLTICSRLRESSLVPILFLTALRSEQCIVQALRLGGDDYLVKPFSAPILVARVEALLRRSRARAPRLINLRDLVLDLGSNEARLNGDLLHLTPTEFRILVRLCQQLNTAISPRELMRDGGSYQLSDREARDILKVHIRHLRQKIETRGSGSIRIVTVRGAGYLLRTESGDRPYSARGS